MPITSVDRDTDALTLTVVADFPASVERLWEAYVDPRQLERFWGPPTYPATRASRSATGSRGRTASPAPSSRRCGCSTASRRPTPAHG